MVQYLIVCRSLTAAQRTQAALTRAGIRSRLLRSPKSIDSEGCSHSVQVSEEVLGEALIVLSRVGLSPKRVFVAAGTGYQEVLL